MSKEEKLATLKRMMEGADLPLKSGATQLVFGDGSAEAEIFFLGEGPGYWEDMKGIPFVGNAGALLNRMLAAIELAREDVFITNVVCYRPPENRDPTEEEMAAFRPWVDKMIETIGPKVIVTLGRFSMGKFLFGAKIGGVHGKPHMVDFRGRKLTVYPMYHPAAALRNGEMMRSFREDFMKLPEVLNLIKTEKHEEADKQKDNSKQMELI